jgi:tetratricopeptide (TPR) repeat protein
MDVRPIGAAVFGAVLLWSVPASAFGRLACFQAPTVHRSADTLIGEVDAALSFHTPAETRACELYSRGLLYQMKGDLPRAIADYSSAIRWMDRFGDAYAARGDAYERLGQHALAAQDYSQPRAASNGSPEALMERCWIRALRGYPLSRALEDCNASLASEAGDFNALAARCLVHLRLNSYAAAVADCDAALKQKPANAAALFLRGLARVHSGDASGGNADIAAAIQAGDHVEETFALYGVKR